MVAVTTSGSAYCHHRRLPEVPASANEGGLSPTCHAWQRMSARGISQAEIDAALAWGRVHHTSHGATTHFIGRRQVERAARERVDISALEGLVVVMALDSGTIITTYRNRSRKMRRR